MKKALTVVLALVLASVWAVAQQSNPSQSTTTTTQSTSTTTQSSNPATIQGCLSQTSTGFAVADKSGNTYQVSGDNEQLRAQVGHEVQITGTVSQQAAATTNLPSEAGVGAQQAANRIDMTGLKSVSDTCSSNSPSTPPSSQLPPKR